MSPRTDNRVIALALSPRGLPERCVMAYKSVEVLNGTIVDLVFDNQEMKITNSYLSAALCERDKRISVLIERIDALELLVPAESGSGITTSTQEILTAARG